MTEKRFEPITDKDGGVKYIRDNTQKRVGLLTFDEFTGVANTLYKENKKLETENEQLLKEKIDTETKLYKANDELLMREDNDSLTEENQRQEFEIANLKKENEQLKSELVESKKAHSNCDKLWWKLHDEKEQLEKENITIKNTIHNMMESERTHIGYNVLKQAYEAIK